MAYGCGVPDGLALMKLYGYARRFGDYDHEAWKATVRVHQTGIMDEWKEKG
jgi:hypothetical protein